MAKLYIPMYNHADGFENLIDAVDAMGESAWVYMEELIRFNLVYRNFARKNGIKSLVERLVVECPILKESMGLLNRLECKFNEIPISDFDIFYWSKEKPFDINGIVMTLSALNKAIEVSGYASDYHSVKSFDRVYDYKPIAHFHVAELWERSPCFDEYDRMYDNGYIQNFFISESYFSDELLSELVKIKCSSDFCKITESLPEYGLPAVYYGGYGNCILVARPKAK